MLRLDEEALAAVRRGQELDPLSPITRSNVAYVLYILRRFDESLAEIEKTVEIVPDNFLPHWWKGVTLLGMERYGDAALAFRQLVELSNRSPYALMYWGAAVGASGRTRR